MTSIDLAVERAARRPFLTAQWRWLAMLNFEVPPDVLQPLVPRGVELDFYQGRTYLSVVGFLFLETRILGWPIPGHRNFEEVNLRLYVRRVVGDEVRRGVVFIKELVPRWAIATVARWAYNENYASLPMRHSRQGFEQGTSTSSLTYGWRVRGSWHGLHLRCQGESRPLESGSHEEFITEHYWGYCRQRNGGTVEYQVGHPRWRIFDAHEATLDCDVAGCYGSQFAEALSAQPVSAFVADGSAIEVHKPTRLRLDE